MSEKSNIVEVARQACGMTPRPAIMECSDELAALRAERDSLDRLLRAAVMERDDWKSQCQATPTMREVVGELRVLQGLLASHFHGQATNLIRDLLRRIDCEPNHGTQTTGETK